MRDARALHGRSALSALPAAAVLGVNAGDGAPTVSLAVLGGLPSSLVDRLEAKGLTTVGAVRDAMIAGNGTITGFLPRENDAIVTANAARRRAIEKALV